MFVIAGVTGHVGSVAARELLRTGARVKVIVRSQDKGAPWLKEGAEIAVGSLEDQAFLQSTLSGAQGFFALLPPNMQAADFYGWQRGIANTISAAVKGSAIAHVVMLSSIGADLLDGTGPVKGLHFMEEALRATHTKLTAIRAGFFQENIAGVISAVKQGVYPNFAASADTKVPMIASKDIGKLIAESLLHPPAKNEIIDLHGPSYSIKDLAQKFETAIGKQVKVIDIAPKDHVQTLMQAGLPKQFAEAYTEMYAAFASGRIRPCGDRLVEGKTSIDDSIKALVL